MTYKLIALLLTFSYFGCFAQRDNCGFKLSGKSKAEFLKQFDTYNTGRVSAIIPTKIEILVVFHVIYNSNTNVSNEDILRELGDLNRDFQLENIDTSNLNPIFKKLVGNPNITFKLATTDINGKATTGIIRKSAGRRVYNFRNQIFSADPIWDNTKYLNVYIGNIRNGKTRGYVNSYPWKNSETDGIALYFKDIGKSTRLLTHEAGHWFGLWHIIEGGCTNENDGISDTPRQITFTNNCPNSKQECGNECLFMNYMDYSDCRVMFTLGQVQRMQEVIFKYRQKLASQN